MAKQKFSAYQLIALLRKSYDAQGWTFLEQVRGGTGVQGSRYCDGLAMSLWPSRGFEIRGFEVKVARNDWLNELKQPEKADEIFKYCTSWYLVAAPGVAKLEEIPAPWGFMEWRDGELEHVKAAPALEPAQLAPAFVASVLRNVLKEHTDKRLKEEYENGRTAGWKEAEKRAANPIEDYETTRLKKSVADFEEKSGIKIDFYQGGKIGEAVKRLMESEVALVYARRDMELIRSTAERIVERMKQDKTQAAAEN